MFSKEESKKIKKEFWTKFGRFSQRKRTKLGLSKRWISHYTGIHDLSLKFDFERKKAIVGIEISGNKLNEEKYYDKLLSLKTILDESFKVNPEWNPQYELPDGKIVIKIYHLLEDVNIHDKNCWPKVFNFFFEHMIIYESFYLEYMEYIKDEQVK